MTTLAHVQSFLIAPGKNVQHPPSIQQATVPTTGQIYSQLDEVFKRASSECDIELVFQPNAQGQQSNQFQNWVNAYARHPSTNAGLVIARHLQSVTTNRPGVGLLFLMLGTDVNGLVNLVISRFPATGGIVVDTARGGLFVEFDDNIFMKNVKAYKSALFCADGPNSQFQDCRAVDKQTNDTRRGASYWIDDFLTCELRTTSMAYSRLVAETIGSAVVRTKDSAVKQELIAAATLMQNQDGQTVSIASLAQTFALTDASTRAISAELHNSALATDVFEFNASAFDKYLPYRRIELDIGVSITAATKDFDDKVRRQRIDDAGLMRYTIEGTVTQQGFRRRI